MPRFDQTGPQGFGPGTGRGAGICAPGDQQVARPGFRYGRGSGGGRGFMGGRGGQGGGGRRLRIRQGGYFSSPDLGNEKAVLNSRKADLESQLRDISQRLEKLSALETQEG